jgi:hypothetical protein
MRPVGVGPISIVVFIVLILNFLGGLLINIMARIFKVLIFLIAYSHAIEIYK